MRTSKGLALALFLGGCVPPAAITTPVGIVYMEENPPAWLIEHEGRHWELAQEMGLEYWWKYYTDFNWMCEEERRAGIEPTEYLDTYPMCEGR